MVTLNYPAPSDARRTMTAPDRSYRQRMDSLGRANEVRSKRAEMKRDLKSGRRHVVPLLLDVPPWLETMKTFDLLLAVPKWGRVKVTGRLKQCQIAPSKTVGGLSPRQRADLVRRISR